MKHYYLATLLLAASALGAAAQNVTIVGKDGINTKFNVDYVQEITFEKMAPAGFTEFKSVTCDPASTGGTATFNFASEDGSTTMQMMVFSTANALYLRDGAYNVTSSNLPNTVDTDEAYTFIMKDGEKKALESGTMEVTSFEDKYTINMDFVLTDGTPFQAIYTGPIDNYSKYLRYTATEAKYLLNMYGEFKLYIADADPTMFELTLDVYGDGMDEYLANGRYALSESLRDVNMIFKKNSYLDILRPNSTSNKFQGALMVVSNDGPDKVLSIDLTLEDGRTVHIDYKGSIK